MKNTLIQKQQRVKISAIHGYGVFSEEDIYPGEVIGECVVLMLEKNEAPSLNPYLFKLPDSDGMPLGLGALYNHAPDPSATYYFDAATQLLMFVARRYIPKGEEITISYGDDWFLSRALPVKEMPWWRARYPFRQILGIVMRLIILLGIYYLITKMVHLR
jgi:hypothetical protein